MKDLFKNLLFWCGFVVGMFIGIVLLFIMVRPAMASVTDVTRDTFGFYEQCMNDNLKRVHTTTKDVVRKFDKQCADAMHNTETYKQLDLVNQSAANQRTLKFRAELMEIAK
jgi:hypothetical protein